MSHTSSSTSIFSSLFSRAIPLSVALLGLAMLGCGGGSSSGSSETTVSTQTAPAASPWAGGWQTNFGPVGLAEVEGNPNLIAGAYEYEADGRIVNGELLGQVQGNTLAVEWQDEPGGMGSGHARFTLNPDGAGWTGTWGRDDSDSDGGEWSGQLISR